MTNFLIRGIPVRLRQRILRFAWKRNLSANQLLLQIIDREIDRLEGNVDEEKERADAFRRLEAIRARLHEKYKKFDDSTKLIREDRDSR